MVFIENLGNILIISIIVIASILIILVIIDKKLYRKIIQSSNSKNIFYLEKIENIKNTGTINTLTSLDQIARNFFVEAFGAKNTEDYSKLENFFKQKNNLESAEFCKLMNHALYSKEKINTKESQKLAPLLIKIVENNHILTKYELKKSQEDKQKGILNFLKRTFKSSQEQNSQEVNNKVA